MITPEASVLLEELAECSPTPRVAFGMAALAGTCDFDLFQVPGECVDTDACRVFCDALSCEDNTITDPGKFSQILADAFAPGAMEEAVTDLVLSAMHALPPSYLTALTDALARELA